MKAEEDGAMADDEGGGRKATAAEVRAQAAQVHRLAERRSARRARQTRGSLPRLARRRNSHSRRRRCTALIRCRPSARSPAEVDPPRQLPRRGRQLDSRSSPPPQPLPHGLARSSRPEQGCTTARTTRLYGGLLCRPWAAPIPRRRRSRTPPALRPDGVREPEWARGTRQSSQPVVGKTDGRVLQEACERADNSLLFAPL